MNPIRLLALAALLLAALPVLALQPPEPRELNQFEFRHASLWWSSVYQQLDELPREWTDSARADLDLLGVHPERAFLDARTGRWGTLILTRSLIPGTGVGNDLRWSDFDQPAPRDHYQLMDATSEAFLDFLRQHESQLGFSAHEMTVPRVQVHANERIQLYIGRAVDGIPVEDSFITANVNSGNLILMGQRNWADIRLDTTPGINGRAALDVLSDYLEGLRPTTFRQPPQLRIIPVSDEPDHLRISGPGQGLDYRLVWVLAPVFRGDIGVWEAMVDAHSGELVAFVDTNHYQREEPGEALASSASTSVGSLGAPSASPSRGLVGGIFPVSNDGQLPDGVQLSQQPMPFAAIRLDGDNIGFSSTGGNAPTSAAGVLSTNLAGQYVNINSACGAVSESGSDFDLDLGDSVTSNCSVPAGTSAGNTNASRTVFYGIGRINEQARGYLPNNNWLTSPITGRTNVAQTCNATWNTGTNTATFFNSGGGCGNTGEVMAVVHHEWGHGMDANSVNPGISRPGEGIADIYAQNMLNDSCIGRGFRPGQVCTGFGDACLECTGVRESDWALQQSGQPHDIAWIQSACTGSGNTPCGRSTHCEGSVVAEAIWDLVHRDLQGFDGSPFNYDVNTALELGTRLTYEGAGAVGSWYQCTTNNGGCNADGGYLQYLAANDDNGSLEDGTPHMSAIFAAFDRHQLACSTPTVQDAGCETAPSEAPGNLSVTNFNEGAELSWDPVDGAEEYWIYRTEGPMGCDFGKARVGQVSGTSFTETGLRNGFDVYYSVVAAGAGGSCSGPMTGCVTATPEQGPTGTVAGTIARGGSGEPLGEVLVEAVGEITFSTLSGSDGSYSLDLLEGEYQLTASRAGFDPAVEPGVVVIEDATTTVNLVLDAPILDLEAEAFSLIVGQDATTAALITFGNTGTRDLAWTLASDAAPQGTAAGRGFEGAFDIDNWQLVNTPGNTGGSVNVEAGPPVEVYLSGGDSDVAGNTDFTIEIPTDGTLSFDWGYQSSDTGEFDRGGYVVNDDFTVLAFNNSQVPFFNQSTSLEVGAGDIFAFRVNTSDGRFGEGILGVTGFEFVADTCNSPEDVSWLSLEPEAGTLAAGESGQSMLMVDSAGLALGDYDAVVCLNTNDPTSPLSILPVSLSVTDQDPAELAVSSAELDFGQLDPGVEASLPLTVSNQASAGALGLSLTGLELAGDDAFALAEGDCQLGVMLDPGQSCTVTVNFLPANFGAFSASLDIGSGDGQLETVALFGEGAPPSAELAVSPPAIDFGSVVVGTTVVSEVSIANVVDEGGLSLTLTALFSTDPAAELTIGGDCEVGRVLAPGEECVVELVFIADRLGSFVNALVTESEDGQLAEVPLTAEVLPVEVFRDRFEND